jgi:hypothetical protein
MSIIKSGTTNTTAYSVDANTDGDLVFIVSESLTAMSITAAGAVSLPTSSLTITSGATLNGGVVVNEDGADVDFRIESDTNTHALFVDGATGEVLVGGSTAIGNAAGRITVEGSNVGAVINLFRNDTSIVAGNGLGVVDFYGNDTTSNTPILLARVGGVASGIHSAGDNPTDVIFETTPDGTETIAEAGRITQAGSYVLKGGTTTAAAGVGIIFPATQVASANANSLDDYEEGTWTPVDGSGAGLSFTVLDARYTKIGRMVECYAQINYPATANGNNAAIGGLPFTMASTVGGSYGAFTAYTNYDQATWLGSAGSSSTFAYNLAGGSIANSTISEKQFRLVWIYEV